MPVLIRLPNVIEKETQCAFFKRPAEIAKILDSGLAATASGSNGAINIWIDRDLRYRCEAYRYNVTVDSKCYTSIKFAKEWAKTWLNKIK